MKTESFELPELVKEFLKPIFGKRCCRQRVSEPRALHLGFGEKIYHGNSKLADAYYGDWEIGTYYCAWRVVKDGTILCGSDDVVESADELNASLKDIEFGAIRSVEQLNNFDVRVRFDTGVVVDFLATTSDGTDECIDINCGSCHQVAEFAIGSGWTIGPSNQPWQR